MERQRIWYCSLRNCDCQGSYHTCPRGFGGCRHHHRSIKTAIRCAKRFKYKTLIVKNWGRKMGDTQRYRIVRWIRPTVVRLVVRSATPSRARAAGRRSAGR